MTSPSPLSPILLDAGMPPVSNASSGEPDLVADNEVNARLENSGSVLGMDSASAYLGPIIMNISSVRRLSRSGRGLWFRTGTTILILSLLATPANAIWELIAGGVVAY